MKKDVLINRRDFLRLSGSVLGTGAVLLFNPGCSSSPDRYGKDDSDIKDFYPEGATWKIKEIVDTSTEGHSFKVVNFTDTKVNTDAIQDAAGYAIKWVQSKPVISYPYLKRADPSITIDSWTITENSFRNHVFTITSPSMQRPKWAHNDYAETYFSTAKTFSFIHPSYSNRILVPGTTSILETNNVIFGTELCQSIVQAEEMSHPGMMWRLGQEITGNMLGHILGLASTGIVGKELKKKSEGIPIQGPSGYIYHPLDLSPALYNDVRVRSPLIQ